MSKRSEFLTELTAHVELPQAVLPNAAKMTVVSGKQIRIENHRGILEFGSDRVVIRFESEKLILAGQELRILGMNRDEILIEGRLQNAEWM